MRNLLPLVIQYAEVPEFPMWEQLLLVLLIVVSGLAFWARFRKAVAQIRAAKPDVAFSLRPVGKRIRSFVLEVMLQSKVIRERPLAGIAHAFVFWGFCAFAVITVNHFASSFGWPFISPGSTAGRLYL